MVAVKDIDSASELDMMLTHMQEMVINCEFKQSELTFVYMANFENILADIRQGQNETKPVVTFQDPQQLYKAMDFSLPTIGTGMEGKILFLAI